MLVDKVMQVITSCNFISAVLSAFAMVYGYKFISRKNTSAHVLCMSALMLTSVGPFKFSSTLSTLHCLPIWKYRYFTMPTHVLALYDIVIIWFDHTLIYCSAHAFEDQR